MEVINLSKNIPYYFSLLNIIFENNHDDIKEFNEWFKYIVSLDKNNLKTRKIWLFINDELLIANLLVKYLCKMTEPNSIIINNLIKINKDLDYQIQTKLLIYINGFEPNILNDLFIYNKKTTGKFYFSNKNINKFIEISDYCNYILTTKYDVSKQKINNSPFKYYPQYYKIIDCKNLKLESIDLKKIEEELNNINIITYLFNWYKL